MKSNETQLAVQANGLLSDYINSLKTILTCKELPKSYREKIEKKLNELKKIKILKPINYGKMTLSKQKAMRSSKEDKTPNQPRSPLGPSNI